jgi:hypothetical protein
MFTQQPATKPHQTCLHPEADEVGPCPIITTLPFKKINCAHPKNMKRKFRVTGPIYNFSSPVFIWKNHIIFSVQLVFKNNNNL